MNRWLHWSVRTTRAPGFAPSKLILLFLYLVLVPPALAEDPVPARTADELRITLHGTVVNERRMPVLGAQVVARFRLTEEEFRTVTGADGGFELDIGPPAEGFDRKVSVHVADGKGRAMVIGEVIQRRSWFDPIGTDDPGRRSVGILPLREAFDLPVRVRRNGRDVQGAEVRIDWEEDRLLADRRRTQSDGRMTLRDVPAGRVVVEARTEGFHGLALANLPFPDETELTVELLPTWGFTVHTVLDSSGEPITGPTIHIMEDTPPPGEQPTRGHHGGLGSLRSLQAPREITEQNGSLEVDGLGRQQQVFVCYSGGPFATGRHSGFNRFGPPQRAVATDTEHVTLRFWERPPPNEARFEIRSSECGQDHAGPVEIGYESMSGGGTIEDGRVDGGAVVFSYHDRHYRRRAIAADGCLADLFREGDGTHFVRPRDLELAILEANGDPVADAVVYASSSYLAAQATTDARGRATMHGLMAKEYEIRVVRPNGSSSDVGKVDVSKESSRAEFTLPELVPVTLRVRIDGQPGLPGEYVLYASHRQPYESLKRSRLAEDATTGILHFEIEKPNRAFTVQLQPRGFTRVERTIGPECDENGFDIPLEITSTTRLTVHVNRPADGEISLLAMRKDPADGSWRRAVHHEDSGTTIDGPVVLMVPPGDCRIVDGLTGLFTEASELAAGESRSVALDLHTTTWFEGQVQLPEPEQRPLGHVQIHAEGLHDGGGVGAAKLEADGRFRIRIPGDRPVRLSFDHPFLEPEFGQSIALAELGPSPVIPMVPGSFAQLVLRSPDRSPIYRAEIVLHRKGDRYGRQATSRMKGATLQFGGYEPGRYDIRISHTKWAAVVLEDVDLGRGIVDLPAVNLSKGATLQVFLDRPDDWRADEVLLRAKYEATVFGYYRRGVLTDGEFWTFAGMASGPWQIEILRNGRTMAVVPVQIEGEGIHSVHHTLPGAKR